MSRPCDTALAVLLPPEIATTVDRWRRSYDPHADEIPSHITMAYPPFVPSQLWREVRPAIVNSLSGYHHFMVRIRHAGVFDSPERVLWLQPEDDGDMRIIHNRLADDFLSYVPPSTLDFVPHITLGFFETTDALKVALADVNHRLRPMSFRVTELSYMEYGEACTWHEVDRIALGTGADAMR